MVKYKVTIQYDECTDNPLGWDSNIAFACEHKRYDLGNATMRELLDKYDYSGNEYDLSAIVDHLSQYGYVDTLSMTDHGNLTVYRGSPNDSWDSGYIGVVFVNNAHVPEFTDIGAYIDDVLDTYNDYLNGNVYYYVIEKYTSDGLEFVDSCGGWYGLDTVQSEARECISYVDDQDIEWDGII